MIDRSVIRDKYWEVHKSAHAHPFLIQQSLIINLVVFFFFFFFEIEFSCILKLQLPLKKLIWLHILKI